MTPSQHASLSLTPVPHRGRWAQGPWAPVGSSSGFETAAAPSRQPGGREKTRSGSILPTDSEPERSLMVPPRKAESLPAFLQLSPSVHRGRESQGAWGHRPVMYSFIKHALSPCCVRASCWVMSAGGTGTGLPAERPTQEPP